LGRLFLREFAFKETTERGTRFKSGSGRAIDLNCPGGSVNRPYHLRCIVNVHAAAFQ
jgi:hypothetical protein